MTIDDERPNVSALRAQNDQEMKDRRKAWIIRHYGIPDAETRREAAYEARHAEYEAHARAIRDAAREASQRAYEEAERRRQERRIAAEAMWMWEVGPDGNR